jgi:antitoxin YefM
MGAVMINGIKQRSVVGKGGKIEIPSSELPEGTTVEIIVLVESSALDETDYLLSNQSNRQQLLQAIESAKNPENLVVISAEEWHEKYRV